MAIPVIHDGPLKCAGCGIEGVGVMPFPLQTDAPLCGTCVEARFPNTGDPAYGRVSKGTKTARPSNGGGRRLVLTRASEIKPERVRWLARDRMPLASVVVVAGEPGLGKSTYTGAHIPAEITTGAAEGDLHGQPGDALILSAEDAWASVIVPRLMAAGADLDRVHRVAMHDVSGEAMFTLPEDVEYLEAACEELRAAGRRVVYIVADPIGALLSGAIDSHKDASVRRALGPLAGLAERQDLVVAVVAHLNKNEAQKLLQRISGSVGFGGAARSVLGFARDPGDPDGDRGAARVIVHCKSNWGRYARTLAARVEGREIDLPDGNRADVGYLRITGESDVTAEDLSGPSTGDDGQDCEEAITAALADGPRASRDVKGAVVAELGCGRRSVERAATRMHDRGELDIERTGFPSATTWAIRSRATYSGATDDSEGWRDCANPHARAESGTSAAQSRHDTDTGATGPDRADVDALFTPNGDATCDGCGALLTRFGGRLACFSCTREAGAS